MCGKTIDFIVNMSPNSISKQGYERQLAMKSNGFETSMNDVIKAKRFKDLNKSWLEWNNIKQVQEQLGFKNAACLELYQPFPASKLVTDGEFKRLPSFLKFSSSITAVATKIAAELFDNKQYISVHWRYEYQMKGESKCRKKILPSRGSGEICFVIFLKRHRSELRDFLNFGDCQDCHKYLQFVHLEDVGEVLSRFKVLSGKEIYLASDADANILNKLRKIVDFKMISDSKSGLKILENESMEKISVIEQALCVQSEKFMGTTYSTWTTTVWMLRSKKFEDKEQIHGYLDLLSAGIV